MYKFKIKELSCMSCFHTIEDALKEFDVSIKAKADVGQGMLTVDSQYSEAQLKSLIEAAGYSVSEVLRV